jgi:hypothetical protein
LDAIASRQNTRAAHVAAGEEWICHRNIVNLKTRRSLPLAQAALHGADVAISIRAAAGLVEQVDSSFRLQSPHADASQRFESGKRSDGPTTHPGLFAQPTGHPMTVPASASLTR